MYQLELCTKRHSRPKRKENPMGKGESAEKVVGAADINQEQKQMIL